MATRLGGASWGVEVTRSVGLLVALVGGSFACGKLPTPRGQGGADDDAGVGGTPPPSGNVTFVDGVTVSTLAGSDSTGAQDGTGGAASFDNPTGIALDGAGNLVITDYDDAVIRLVTPQGVVTSVATGTNFVNPFDVIVASDGTYYVGTDADSNGSKTSTTGTIWRVVPLAGGGLATPTVAAAGFSRPRGLALAGGDVLFVSDRDESVVDMQPMAASSPSLLAGTSNSQGFQDGSGAAAQFNTPVGVAALPDGSFAVADSFNNRIRRVTSSGDVTTLAGDGTWALNDGPAASAQFARPSAVAADAAGNVYVSDIDNHRIRRIDTSGNVETVAGDGNASYADGAGNVAEFYGQEGIAVTSDGKTLYVADGNGGDGSAHSHLRVITLP
jgi:sugar lactone lactonase YvrE